MTDTVTEETAPEIQMTKAELTDLISRKVGEAIASKLKANDALKSENASLTAQAARVAELEEQLSGKQQTAAQKWDTERSQFEAQHKALQSEYDRSQTEAKTITQRWHDTHRREFVTALAIEAGAAASAASDISRLYPGDRVTITETDNGLTASMSDPLTGQSIDPKEAMVAWLAEKPHLMAARSGGSGSAGSHAPKPTGPADALNGKSEAEQFKAAFGQNQGQ